MDGFFIIPREVYDLDYDQTLPAETVDSYNTRETGTAKTFEEIMEMNTRQAIFDLVSYRQDPHMFHQANMRTFTYPDPVKGNMPISITTLWMDRVIDSVMTYYDLPIVSPKYSALADIWVNRLAMDNCGFTAQLQLDAANKIVGFVATSTNSCVAQITGVVLQESSTVRMEHYGVESTAIVTMTAGVPQTLTLTTPLVL